MGNWSELPPEIIHMISLRIGNPFDLIHFRSVCSWWRSSSLSTFQPLPSLRCPLPPDVGGCGDDCHIVTSRVYLIKSLSHDPPRFWLFKLQEQEKGVLALQCLFYRITSSERGRSYPSLYVDLFNSQVIEIAREDVACYTSWWDLFDDGGSENKDEERIGLMMLGLGNKEFMILGKLSFKCLGIYRSFEKRWTVIDTTRGPFQEGITSFNGKFYVIDITGVTKVVKPTLELISFQRSRPCDKTRKRWLVKSEDKLLLVEMCTENIYEYRRRELLAEKGWFEISELNEERNDWIQVEDLGGRILFLDHHCSFSCLPNQIPGFRPNSIIFSDMYGGDIREFQVFEFGQQGFRSFQDISEYAQLFPSPPWIISNEWLITKH